MPTLFFSTSRCLAWPNELIGRGFGSRRVNFDSALKMSAIFNADASASNVTSDGALFRDFDAAPGMDVADNLAVDKHFAGVDFRLELGRRADGQLMTAD